ncbi:mannitol dehydrogenase family protein [Vibrio sp. ZSDZ65]|uniref:Mannitol dehydrogenase family protein n=1 Tax=Vibrio qingdaonensis TaxID=2829491 RepID=A0A9X3CM23_9VIBR|nr:mannitol dehydrogenase family protein [Vibrio qingdaonensis]MCW8345888.1 mannitol dehydrogenase family protein [Vibrio qingdaonensis]
MLEKILKGSFNEATTYDRAELNSKIVHIGFGAFHRGHQAVYNDITNQLSDEKWGISEINMFGASDLMTSLQQQNNLFTVVETSKAAVNTRLVRTIVDSIHTPSTGIDKAIEKLVEPQVAIVSMTITEKGYCADPQSRTIDLTNNLIKHDLENATSPQSAIGLITEALRIRRDKGLQPFSIMSCDNIPENGALTKGVIVEFARQLDDQLGAWIESNVTFPSTMVDRIVPAMTEEEFDTIERHTGYRDPCGIICEDFRQWVIEDNFVAGRPEWEKAGAMLVNDVLPYEEMKLRMLNGSHSFLAYNGSLAGYEYIYQCMEDGVFKSVTKKLMVEEQGRSLNPALEIDLEEYAQLLLERFSNPNIKHKTHQIAMDGSQKLPQRALDPFLTLQERGVVPKIQPLIIAGWMHYLLNSDESMREIHDPLAPTFKDIMTLINDKSNIANRFLDIESVFGSHGKMNTQLIDEVLNAFNKINDLGIKKTIESLA